MREWKFNHIDFSTYPFYGQDDLGVFLAPERTTVKIWAPTARIVEFRLFNDGKSGDAFLKTELNSVGNGIWETILEGDYEGKYYSLKINDGDWLEEIPDIYARCVGVNGKRGMIYDPAGTNPPDWEEDKRPFLENYTDAVIYELHIRDYTISPNSGIMNRGMFLGLTEEVTTSPEGLETGLSHLKSLGITHVHLLPVFDFFTVDEEDPVNKYNWGYDPLNFNAVEGSYATDPFDGRIRILELKKMVQSLHNAGIGVVMDVVYNHTYFTKRSVFNNTVPGYFYRQKTDGTFADASGCGNEVATERSMVRKYIIDSLKYWVNEFHLDGFRFDLMGVYDIETMWSIREEMDRISPGLLLYGEGWTAAESPMRESYRAVKGNIARLPGIAAFNDDFRDALVGNHGLENTRGFISGLGLREESVKFGIIGATEHPQIVYDYVETSVKPWAANSSQCINYATCHDNYTLWDRLKLSCPEATDNEMRKMVRLSGALLLTSQGIPFLHSGMEFCRTKGGDGNSYKSPDTVNQINWSLKSDYLDVFEYFRKLIYLRKKHPALRMNDPSMIKNTIHFCTDYKTGMAGYCLDGKAVNDPWEYAVLIFNGNREALSVSIPEGKYLMIANGDDINENGIGETVSEEIKIEGISMVILAIIK